VHTRTRETSVNLTWTLFDFGLRSSNLENSRQLLVAANATQDATLQTVFMTAAQAYYDLRMAQAALDASKEAEKLAEESYKAADAKYAAGVGSLADKLQAQTNYAQAKSNRVKANGELNSSQGALAIAMGLNANIAFTLTADRTSLPDGKFHQAIDALVEEAVRTHPSLIAAQAQLKAAQASVDAAKAEGMPSVAITGSFDKSDQFGQYPRDTFVKNGSIGFQVKIPLFEGLGRSYRIQSAEAQVESRMADLANTEQQVSLEVWKSYQSLLTESENLNSTDDLLQSADQSFKVALGRYKAGVGNMLELLSAQSSRASAQQQRIQALSNWQFARLKLAGSLGKLGLWSIQ
jgi:outer membrane protein